MSATVPIVLSVAGSDPCGGAGLQADLKALTMTGVYGATAATAITVQNSLGVSRVFPLEPQLLTEQVRAVLTDLNVGVIKTGMMGSAANARAMTAILDDFPGEIVCDPVIRASDKTDLCRDPDLDATRELIARATVVTPNRMELELLTDGKAETPAAAVALISGLFADNPRLSGVVLKGGHFREHKETVCDRLFLKNENGHAIEGVRATRPRRQSSPHGTGCVFAALIAGFSARDYGIVPAFGEASRLMDHLLANTFTPSTGTALMSFLPGHSPDTPR